jgi:hypothetical protein
MLLNLSDIRAHKILKYGKIQTVFYTKTAAFKMQNPEPGEFGVYYEELKILVLR